MRYAILAAALAIASAAATAAAPAPRTALAPVRQGAAIRMMSLPLSFEANRGQFDPRVRFRTRAGAASIFLTDTEAVMVLPGKPLTGSAKAAPRDRQPIRRGPGAVLRMQLVGADRDPASAGAQKLPGTVSYLTGSSPKAWRTRIPTYRQARFSGVYPGTDLVYYGNPRRLEYDFIVNPGADPGRIRLAFAGAQKLRVAPSGDLVATTGVGDVCWKRPFAYQMQGTRRVQVACDYSIAPGARSVSFRLARYDATRPLVVDPSLAYSTYLGGSLEDHGWGVALDAAGAAYVTGATFSTNFPTTAGAYRTTAAAWSDAFVSKLNAAGTALVYSTYLCGSGADYAQAIAVDSAGSAYVTGYTDSENFPTTAGAPQAAHAGWGDAFVTRLNADGSGLVYSTYLGGAEADTGKAIAVDASGAALVTGETRSTDFPTTTGAYQTSLAAGSDAFVTKLNPTGTALTWSSYLGGSNDDGGQGIAIDGSGAACVTGYARSSNFPTTTGAYQTASGGAADIFVTRFTADGAGLTASTYLGGTGDEAGMSIALDSGGAPSVTGHTFSANFPTTAGAYQSTIGGGSDACIAKLSADLVTLVGSTFLGGSANDAGVAIAIGPAGAAFVTGWTESSDFPTTTGAHQALFGGVSDAFVARVSPTGALLRYSTYLGGDSDDSGNSIALNASGAVCVAGHTWSGNFPTTTGALQTTRGGEWDAIVAKFAFPLPTGLAVSPAAGVPGAAVSLTATLTVEGAGLAGKSVSFTVGGTAAGSATTDASGIATLSYTIPAAAAPGAQTIAASFAGDDSFEPAAGTAALTVLKPTWAFVGAKTKAICDRMNLTATLFGTVGTVKLAGKTVTFSVDGVNIGTAVTLGAPNQGIAILPYTLTDALGVGAHTMGVSFAGDAEYAACSGSGTLTVTPAVTALTAADAYISAGKRIQLKAILNRMDGFMAGKTVRFKVDGAVVGSGTTDSKGLAMCGFQASGGFAMGNHVIVADFAGDATNLASTSTSKLVCIEASWIYVSPKTAAIFTKPNLSAQLRTLYTNRALIGKTVTFQLDGVPIGSGITTTTPVMSAAWINGFAITEAFTPGAHTIAASFAGDGDSTDSVGLGTLTVTKGTTYTTTYANTVVIGGTALLKATLSCPGGFVPGKSIVFSVDGTPVRTLTTNASGVASFTYTAPFDLAPGAHTLSADFAGDATCLSSTGSAALTVNKENSSLYVSGRTVAIYDKPNLGAQLKGLPANRGLIGKTITFQIDGTTVGTATTASTPVSGGAFLMAFPIPDTLTPGVHTLSASFAGDATTQAAAGSGALTVTRANSSLSIANATVAAGATVTLTATLASNGGMSAGRTVTFLVDGAAVGTATTNASGKATLSYTASIAAGSHTLRAEFAGDTILNASAGTATLTVTP